MSAEANTNQIVSFGCRLNTYEAEVMRQHAENRGLEGAIIFNTCAVTAEAVRQSQQAIRKARREHPEAKIIVTGCAAQIEPQRFAAMQEVDIVLGNVEKLQQGSYDFGTTERVRVNDIMSVRETAAQFVDGFKDRARAFVQIQNGCDHRCTFCVIPFGRGNSRSVGMGEVIRQTERLVESGFAEIVLTGVDLTAYGADLPGEATLGQLVRKLLARVPRLRRLRLSSLDAIEVDEALWQAIAEDDRLMPHFHLSVQAGDDLILKRMKRRHLRHHTIAFCDRVRRLRPDAVFGADLIAGFPTESEDMAANTRALVADAGLTYLHVFPFSPRPGTPAARMPQLAKPLIKQRAAALRALGEEMQVKHFARLVGSQQEVLVESTGRGRTRCFAPVTFAGDARPGTLLTLTISGHNREHLTGTQ
jgi:threonylcarbamoyladenosine tRNA methylthiotransferase MtaB